MPATELGSRGLEMPALWGLKPRSRHHLLTYKVVCECVSENVNHRMETVEERPILNGKVDVSEKVKSELLIEGCSLAEPAKAEWLSTWNGEYEHGGR